MLFRSLTKESTKVLARFCEEHMGSVPRRSTVMDNINNFAFYCNLNDLGSLSLDQKWKLRKKRRAEIEKRLSSILQLTSFEQMATDAGGMQCREYLDVGVLALPVSENPMAFSNTQGCMPVGFGGSFEQVNVYPPVSGVLTYPPPPSTFLPPGEGYTSRLWSQQPGPDGRRW